MSALQTKVPGNHQNGHAEGVLAQGQTFGVLSRSFRGKERVEDKDQAETVLLS